VTSDPHYIKNLLTAFQESPGPTTDIKELEERGLSYQSPEFYFHMRLLNDQDFVERDDGEAGIGTTTMLDGHYSWLPIPLRLTASGQEFAEAMNNSKAFEAVKKSFVSSSLAVMRDIAVSVLKAEIGKHGLPLGH
jgi:hypothetical protein